MSGIIFVDTETTGLEPSLHEIWEVALIEETGKEHLFYRNPIQLEMGDPTSLRISGFYDRIRSETRRPAMEMLNGMAQVGADEISEDAKLALAIANLTAGKHLVGAVPSFDARFIEILMRRNGVCPAWHYHLVDVEAMVAGALHIAPPWDTNELAQRIGVPKLDGKHTAMGDARWAKAMYEAALAG
jgi:DNA polymerase III epsilon subunit-like protein